MAGIPGLEPRLTESESAVLPLDDIPTTALHHNLFFIKLQDVFYCYATYSRKIRCE